MKVLKQLSFIKRNSDEEACNKCLVCPLTKQTRLSFLLSMTRTLNVFDLIHMDIWGPYRTPTHIGYRFFLTIIDDHSRMTWLFFMKFKNVVFEILRCFFTLVKNQFNSSIKRVRTDNRIKFFNKECRLLFESLGVVHESSCSHTP